jgi:hypothetical protein
MSAAASAAGVSAKAGSENRRQLHGGKRQRRGGVAAWRLALAALAAMALISIEIGSFGGYRQSRMACQRNGRASGKAASSSKSAARKSKAWQQWRLIVKRRNFIGESWQ